MNNFAEYLKTRPFGNQLATVLRVARKSKGIAIETICRDLKFPLEQYLQWEAKKDYPNLFQWKNLCDYLKVNIDSCRSGVIDDSKDIEVGAYSNRSGFFVPPIYATRQATSNRWLSPLIEYFRFRLGSEAFKSFFASMDLDEDYFRLYDNQVNFNLIQDLFRGLLKLGVDEQEMRQIVKAGVRSLYPTILQGMYSIYKTPDFIFLNLDYLNNRFDLNFKYTLVQESPDGCFIANTSAEWIKTEFYIDPVLLRWYHLYKREWIRNVIEFVSHREIGMEEIELDDKGDVECLFQIQVLSSSR